jgi:neutral ceramidase
MRANLYAGAARVDVTPARPVWLDGMIRSHESTGVHDPVHARVLVLGGSPDPRDAVALVSVEVCVIDQETGDAIRAAVERAAGIPAGRVLPAATHTHSAPAVMGIFNPREDRFVGELTEAVAAAAARAAAGMRPALMGTGAGAEHTISDYRRLMGRAGKVIMNWEPAAPGEIIGPLGVPDPEVGVVKVVEAAEPHAVMALLFNHAGHPNVLSGDNYLVSGDYPGAASTILEEAYGGVALFFNGAQGSVDIDGLRHRDWEGRDRAGRALAASVRAVADCLRPEPQTPFAFADASYEVPGRLITDEEWRWARGILEKTGGVVAPAADGIGDDYRAVFYKRLHDRGPRGLPARQACLALGDCALLTFPGELYTEIGMRIKAGSPFKRTFILGLANGYVGYLPTRKAVGEGGYAEDTRWVDASAEDTVYARSAALLAAARGGSHREEGEES